MMDQDPQAYWKRVRMPAELTTAGWTLERHNETLPFRLHNTRLSLSTEGFADPSEAIARGREMAEMVEQAFDAGQAVTTNAEQELVTSLPEELNAKGWALERDAFDGHKFWFCWRADVRTDNYLTPAMAIAEARALDQGQTMQGATMTAYAGPRTCAQCGRELGGGDYRNAAGQCYECAGKGTTKKERAAAVLLVGELEPPLPENSTANEGEKPATAPPLETTDHGEAVIEAIEALDLAELRRGRDLFVTFMWKRNAKRVAVTIKLDPGPPLVRTRLPADQALPRAVLELLAQAVAAAQVKKKRKRAARIKLVLQTKPKRRGVLPVKTKTATKNPAAKKRSHHRKKV